MVVTSIADLTASQKEDLVAGLSGLIVGSTEEVTAEKLQAVATASGNSVSAPVAALFAKVLTSAEKGVEAFTPGPGGGGGGGGGGGDVDDGCALCVNVVDSPFPSTSLPSPTGYASSTSLLVGPILYSISDGSSTKASAKCRPKLCLL